MKVKKDERRNTRIDLWHLRCGVAVL